jgi:hypothetical protein
MRKQKKSVLVLAMITAFAATALLLPGLLGAGSLDPPDTGSPVPTMSTLEEVYNNLNVLEYKLNQLLCIQGGDVWITYYGDDDGDGYGDPNVTWEGCQPPDGYVENDTDCNDEDALINPGACDIPDNDIDEDCDGTALIASEWRFVDQCNGTVLDTVTDLVWLKNANCLGEKKIWNTAKNYAEDLADGQCGLTDESQAVDWRLPTKVELQGIGTDPPSTWYSGTPPPGSWTKPGSPFYNVQSSTYWSSTGFAGPPGYDWDKVWYLSMSDGNVYYYDKDASGYVWPVR